MPIFYAFGDLATKTPQLTIPLWQVLLYVTLISIAAMFERYRVVLLLSYLFACYWVFVENLKLLAVNQVSVITVILIAVFAVVGFTFAVYHMVTAKY